MKVPFLDMKARHAPLREEFMRAIGEVVDSGALAGGPFVEKFERDFAACCATRFAVGVGSGTEALWLTMVAMGIGPGDEVITTPMTFAATVEAICLTGAKPVFVDIHDRTYTLDPAGLEDALTGRTKAILPVHLFGQTADMDPILQIAAKRGIRVIEDAAQAHGAEYHGRRCGSLGDAACFSFYPSKNLGAFGDGGAVVTSDEKIAQKVRMLRDHGQSEKNRHAIVGWNSRLDAIQAAVLSVKIRHLARDNQTRREIARAYDRAFADLVDVLTPHSRAGASHVHHIYAIRVRNREALLRTFDARGIGHSVHYPVPVHLQPAYRILGHSAGDFPVAERCAKEFVSLPLYPEMTGEQFTFVADTVRETFGACISA
jgi:dTDP-4-amino-4,6-dideoxygalactose transaminase